MAVETKLGRISNISLGTGGYDDAMFGVSVTLSFSDSTGVGDFKGTWATYPKSAKYSAEEWDALHAEAYQWLRELMANARANRQFLEEVMARA